uniref:C2H2-type domain-containing protein n=1 Tax=Ciona savignyi TaxID=51511 RepID=H2YQ02_CIOSA
MSYLLPECVDDPEDFTKDFFFTEIGPFGVSGFNMDGKEVGLHCEICDFNLDTPLLPITHFAGKKHTGNVRQLRKSKDLVVISSTGQEDDPDNMFLPDLCKICNAELNTPDQSQAHYMSDKHQKKVRHYYLVKVGVKSGKEELDEEDIKDKTEDEYCHLCGCDFTSEIVAETHYAGKKHAKKLKEQMEKPFNNKYWSNCYACDVIFSNERQYEIHLKGSKHHMMTEKLAEKKGDLAHRRAQIEEEIKKEAARRARLEKELAALQAAEKRAKQLK